MFLNKQCSTNHYVTHAVVRQVKRHNKKVNAIGIIILSVSVKGISALWIDMWLTGAKIITHKSLIDQWSHEWGQFVT